jgi:hypothetical protein
MKHFPSIAINIIKKSLSHLPKEHVEIILNWSVIIGEYSANCSPHKIKFTKNKLNNDVKILMINCYNSSFANNLSFSRELIVARVNNYFGYKAIDNVEFIVL